MSSPVANTRTSNPKRLQTHKLTVIVTNCRSLVNKKAELINLLDSTKADIAICTETWLNSSISDSEICPDNYSLFRNDRTDRRGGGVAILTSNKLMVSQPVEYMCNNSELLWAEIQLVGCKKLMIGSFYKPPSMTNPEYLDEISRTVSNMINTNTHIWLAGDFNLPDIDWYLTAQHMPTNSASSSAQLSSGTTSQYQ